MRRRKFLTLLGSVAVACPLAARAQQTGKLPTVAFILYSASSDAPDAPWRAAFTERLRELGWTDGRTVAIEYRWSEGHPERVAEIAAE
jgi:putative tryptophan/tyrosine transport system substrate-binding protein